LTPAEPLPPAVPPYRPDTDHLHRQLGQAHAYVGQLGAEMNRRAAEANALHDENEALRRRIAVLEAQAGQSCPGRIEGVVV
jgi:regulator of replication initiation timing